MKSAGLFDTLCVLELEAGIADMSLSPELSYLQKLTLEGRWKDVGSYLDPLREAMDDFAAVCAEFISFVVQLVIIFSCYKVEFTLLRQQFLEVLSDQQGSILSSARDDKMIDINDDNQLARETKMNDLVLMLRQMKGLCTAEVRYM